jgi:hypothetical protein
MDDLCGDGDEIARFTSWNFLIVSNQVSARKSLCDSQIDVSAVSAEALPLMIMERSHGLFLTPATVQFVKEHDLIRGVIKNVRKCNTVRHCPAYAGGQTACRNNWRN